MEPHRANMEGFLQHTRAMQEQIARLRAEMGAAEATGTAGGGLVSVTMNAQGEIRELRIDPSVVDAARVNALEELLITAFADANQALRQYAEERMRPISRGFDVFGGLPTPG